MLRMKWTSPGSDSLEDTGKGTPSKTEEAEPLDLRLYICTRSSHFERHV
jgi:hypothetical protein